MWLVGDVDGLGVVESLFFGWWVVGFVGWGFVIVVVGVEGCIGDDGVC